MVTQNIVPTSNFHKILIIDIETVPFCNDWENMSVELKHHWQHKMKFLHLSEEQKTEPEAIFKDKAGIYAEFGKIVCIGMGYISDQNGSNEVRLKSIQHDDEKTLLTEFCSTLKTFTEQHKEVVFCGHNIKEFDIPYICRRMLINGIKLPSCLNIAGLKPWQITHQDTLELWRFGDYKNYTSLDLLAQVLGVPSSKGDIDGSMVAKTYWEQGDLKRIAEYCLRDVYTTTLVYLKLKGWDKDLPKATYV